MAVPQPHPHPTKPGYVAVSTNAAGDYYERLPSGSACQGCPDRKACHTAPGDREMTCHFGYVWAPISDYVAMKLEGIDPTVISGPLVGEDIGS